MRPFKAVLSNELVRRAACWLVSLYMRLVYATTRWQVVGAGSPESYWKDQQPFIVCFWHGRLLMQPYAWRSNMPFNMLISQHRDGQLISKTVSYFGIRTIAGSTNKGGTSALRGMIAALKSGEAIGITPDGPKGPRMRASEGVISIARLAGVPVVPLTYSTSRGKVLKSWDRFLIPFPFSSGIFIWGEPIAVARGSDVAAINAARQDLEEGLNQITRTADEMMGRELVEPDGLVQESSG